MNNVAAKPLAAQLHAVACRKDHNDGACAFTWGAAYETALWSRRAADLKAAGLTDAQAVAAARALVRL